MSITRTWGVVLSVLGLLLLALTPILQSTSPSPTERCSGLPEAEIRRCVAAAANELAREQSSLWMIALSGMLLIALGAFLGLRKGPRKMSVRDASHALGASTQQVRALAADGTIRSFRDASGQLLLEREEILKLAGR